MSFSKVYGAGTKSRTRDLLITSQLLYQLSYAGTNIFQFSVQPLRPLVEAKRSFFEGANSIAFTPA